MNIVRKVLLLLLAIALGVSLALPAAAQTGPEADAREATVSPAPEDTGSGEKGPVSEEAHGDEESAPEESPLPETPQEGSEAPEEDTEPLLDPEELEQLVDEFRKERGLNEDNFSVSFCYTGTGETWSWNGDRYFPAASLYKLSLMMGLARKVSTGELKQEDEINGLGISQIEKMSLTYSNNEISEMMIGYFGPFRDYRLMQAEMAGVPEEELPEEYFSSNIFSADFMLGVLQTLYASPETYPNVIDCLLAAQPEHYFRMNLEGRYDVAQKYGGGDHYLHTSAIIYTPTPILVTVMTYYATNAEWIIGDMGELLADYSLTLDERAAKREERLREEEEARKAEEEARKRAQEEKAAQEKAALEQQRRELEQQKAAQEEKAAQEAAALASQQAEQRQEAVPLLVVLLVLAAALLILLVLFFVRKLRHREKTTVR